MKDPAMVTFNIENNAMGTANVLQIAKTHNLG